MSTLLRRRRGGSPSPQVQVQVQVQQQRRPGSRSGRLLVAAEDRLHVVRPTRRVLNAVFPDHWSFMLGEIALYCFAILLLTGTYLTFFYDPSMAEKPYRGAYEPLRDVSMSQAYRSTIDISFDVRGGLLIRQIHHWAALLFMAAVLLHLCRTFVGGAFRKPRELTWLTGVVILIVCLLEGFSGYTLPDDVISGASLHIADGIMRSLPLIGTWVEFAVFGGPYPGHVILQRLYIIHVLLVPGLLMALFAVHLALVVRQRHTTAVPRRPRSAAAGRDHRGVGMRAYPAYAVRAAGLFLLVAGVLAALGGLAQINPVWFYGPYHPAVVSSNSQPDWYTFFLEGGLRFFPPWEIRAGGYAVPAVFWPGAVLPTVMFVITASYPWLEARLSRDHREHHVAQRARDAPVRSAIGAAGLAFYLVLTLGATDDMAAKTFDWSIETVVWIGQAAVVLGPCLAFVITLRTCRRLQARDRERARTGVPTGIVTRTADGDWAEVVAVDGDVP